MTSAGYQRFFLEPTDAWHRRYEALRMVFVDQQSPKEVAQRFEVSYGTLCNWVGEFRSQRNNHERPPFFKCPLEDVLRVRRTTLNPRNRKSRSQTFESYH